MRIELFPDGMPLFWEFSSSFRWIFGQFQDFFFFWDFCANNAFKNWCCWRIIHCSRTVAHLLKKRLCILHTDTLLSANIKYLVHTSLEQKVVKMDNFLLYYSAMKAHMVFPYNTHTHSSRHIEKWTCNKKGEINLQIAFKRAGPLLCKRAHRTDQVKVRVLLFNWWRYVVVVICMENKKDH